MVQSLMLSSKLVGGRTLNLEPSTLNLFPNGEMIGARQPSNLRTLLVLGRASNLPTVWSNCFAGWLLGGGGE